MLKKVELDEEQIDLIIKILQERLEELSSIIKFDSAGLETETIQAFQLEHRDISNVLREITFFAK